MCVFGCDVMFCVCVDVMKMFVVVVVDGVM